MDTIPESRLCFLRKWETPKPLGPLKKTKPVVVFSVSLESPILGNLHIRISHVNCFLFHPPIYKWMAISKWCAPKGRI